jgi:hypothetical protein
LILDSGKRVAKRALARAIAPNQPVRGKRSAARIAKQHGKFNGDGHLAQKSRINWLNGTEKGALNLPAVFAGLYRGAPTTSGKYTILVFPHRRHCVGQPKPDTNQCDYDKKCREVHYHPMTIVVGTLVTFIFCQILNRRWGR